VRDYIRLSFAVYGLKPCLAVFFAVSYIKMLIIVQNDFLAFIFNPTFAPPVNISTKQFMSCGNKGIICGRILCFPLNSKSPTNSLLLA
jgi:hypothetical protein